MNRCSKWLGHVSRTDKPIPRTTDNPLFVRWIGMFSRCYGHCSDYRPYKRHGIKIADEWHGIDGFYRFKKWSEENGFSPELVIDRVDGLGPYAPWNCRWITKQQNNINRLDAHFVNFNGEEKSIAELAHEHNIPYRTLYLRLLRGWDVSDAVTRKIRPRRQRSSG